MNQTLFKPKCPTPSPAEPRIKIFTKEITISNHKMKQVLFFLLLLISISSCKENYTETEQEKTKEKTKTASVRISPVERTSEPIPIVASGTIGSKAEINLSFKIGGIIQRLYAKETQSVKKGQLLASLSTTEIDAQVMKAKQAVQKWERDLVRVKKMYADTAATLENVEDLSTQVAVAKSDLAIAEFNQQYAKITAPVSGRILKRFSENNELVGPGTPVFRIATNNGKGFALNIGVADKDVIRIKIGDPAKVTFDAHANTTFDATVTEIAEAADPRTGVFPIELTILAQKGKLLKNGFIGKVQLSPSRQDPYIKVPINALVEGYQNKANIYTVKDGVAIKQVVQPLYIGNDFFTISDNQLVGIDEVVTDGAAYLKEGLAVKIVE